MAPSIRGGDQRREFASSFPSAELRRRIPLSNPWILTLVGAHKTKAGQLVLPVSVPVQAPPSDHLVASVVDRGDRMQGLHRCIV
jgi:hypothetical protein